MKKLKLNLQKLSHNTEVLTRSQLKKVLGGANDGERDGSGDVNCAGYGVNRCSADCPCANDNDVCNNSGYCQSRPIV
jgi:hypothetical protein